MFSFRFQYTQIVLKKDVEELTVRVAELEAELKESQEVFATKEQRYLLQIKDLQQKVFIVHIIH